LSVLNWIDDARNDQCKDCKGSLNIVTALAHICNSNPKAEVTGFLV